MIPGPKKSWFKKSVKLEKHLSNLIWERRIIILSIILGRVIMSNLQAHIQEMEQSEWGDIWG
jgi:hypothetical protein